MAGAQQQEEARQTLRVRDMGTPGGLFRRCMDQIHVQHTLGQRLRGVALAAGLMTDADCYAELLAQFYVATSALEDAMDRLLRRRPDDEKNDGGGGGGGGTRLVRAVAALGYRFKPLYEADLAHLFGVRSDDAAALAARVRELTTPPAAAYAARLRDAHAREVVAAAFILHGPLVIGGGAALKPRVRKAFGEGATHVFSPVVGSGRAERRDLFIKCYDELLRSLDNKEAKAAADEIVAVCGECMALNNDMMMAVERRPWWSKWLWAGVAAAGAAVAYGLLLKLKN